MQYLQNLLPALAGRKQAKNANKLALASESLQDIRIAGRNQSALQGLKLQVAGNNRQNKRNAQAFNANKAAQQLNSSLAANQAVVDAFERQYGKEAAEGFAQAQAASRGLLGTGLASQINQAQKMRLAAIDEAAKQGDRARLQGEQAQTASLVASAFSGYALNTSLVALDHTKVKVQRQKVQSFGKALLKDVGRGVAGYFGGSFAVDAIDKVQGYENTYQQGNAMLQGALNTIYGENAPQLKTASRPQWSSVVGGVSSGGGGWAQGFQSVIANQKDGNNAGMSGKQLSGFISDFQTWLGGSQGQSQPRAPLNQPQLSLPSFGKQPSKQFDWNSLVTGIGGYFKR